QEQKNRGGNIEIGAQNCFAVEQRLVEEVVPDAIQHEADIGEKQQLVAHPYVPPRPVESQMLDDVVDPPTGVVEEFALDPGGRAAQVCEPARSQRLRVEMGRVHMAGDDQLRLAEQ